MKRYPEIAYLACWSLIAAGCAHTPPLTMRVPAEGTTLRILPGARSGAALEAVREVARRMSLVDERGQVRALVACGEGIEVHVRPGMTLRIEEGRSGVALVSFVEGRTIPLPAPEEMERGIATEAGTFFLERGTAALALRPAGAEGGELIEAVPLLEADGFAVYFAPGAGAGRYEKFSVAGAAHFMGMLQSDTAGHEYMWSGFLFTMFVAAVVIAVLIATDFGK